MLSIQFVGQGMLQLLPYTPDLPQPGEITKKDVKKILLTTRFQSYEIMFIPFNDFFSSKSGSKSLIEHVFIQLFILQNDTIIFKA